MKDTANVASPGAFLARMAAKPGQTTSLRTHIADRERMRRLCQPDTAVSHVVHRVEPLKPRHPVDEVEPRPRDRAVVRYDQIVPVGVASDVRVQLVHFRQQARSGWRSYGLTDRGQSWASLVSSYIFCCGVQ